MTDKEVIKVCSKDGSNVRKIGLVAVLTSDPALYKPGAWNGATI